MRVPAAVLALAVCALPCSTSSLGAQAPQAAPPADATVVANPHYVSIPLEIEEAAAIDGCGPIRTFFTVVLPMLRPTLISVGILEIMWVWNDYLVALIFIGSQAEKQVLTMRLAEIVGSRGNDWQLLTAGAFISMILPVTVFLALQRYFVRGLLAGSVKG